MPVFEDANVQVQAVAVRHGHAVPALAYRFDTADGSVVFSGDTTVNDDLVALARGADILVHCVADLGYLERHGFTGEALERMAGLNTDVTQVGGVAERAGVNELILTHYLPAEPDAITAEQWAARRATASAGPPRRPAIACAGPFRIRRVQEAVPRSHGESPPGGAARCRGCSWPRRPQTPVGRSAAGPAAPWRAASGDDGGSTGRCDRGSEESVSCGFSLEVECDQSGIVCRGVVGQLQPGLRAAGPQERERQRDAGGDRRRCREEGEVVAADQRGGDPVVGGQQALRPIRGDRAEDGQPERAADLLGDVGDPGAEARVGGAERRPSRG